MNKRQVLRVLGAFLLVSLSCNFIQSNLPLNDETPATQVVLNEIRFLPANEQPAFVELKSLADRTSLSGMVLKNELGDSYTIPENIPDLNANKLLLILFDGTNSVDGNIVHADRLEFINSESGFLELYSAENILFDRVAWGLGQPGSVRLSRGGMISEIVAGSTIGRFPLSTRVDPLEWTIFYPNQSTPGAANPQPGVEIMIPLNSAVIRDTSLELSWYPVPGAIEYHVQIASDVTFSAPVIGENTSIPALNVELQPGTYFWRVQAIAENSTTAEFSPAQTIKIDPQFSSAHLAKPLMQTTLAVPFIGQHKDTQMLLLESKNEEGEHGWGVAHPALDRADPADNTNCANASIAMVNAFLGGDLSQDRIGYEVFKDFWDGPEYDLNYGAGMYDFQVTDALTFALEAAPEYHLAPDDPDILWADVQGEIDAGNPILATKPGHAFVITGYYEDASTRYVFINDPWWGAYAIDITQMDWKSYWKISPDSIPVTDPDIDQDSDGDGIVDFDETNRFGTNPNDADSDEDDVPDKEDVRASIFDEKYGFAVTGQLRGRDFDGDGVMMELDEDSDDGGCFDGIEDYNFDGKLTEPETYNFEKGDDACFWGTSEILLDTTNVDSDGGTHHQRLHTYITFSLRAMEQGKLQGLAQILYTHTGEFFNELCSGTHDIGTQSYQADLEGEFQKLPDGGTLVTFTATPDHGEPYTIDWVSSCPVTNEQNEGWYWGGSGGTLKDGVYDYFVDMAGTTNVNGEFWQKIHMEQGQGLP